MMSFPVPSGDIIFPCAEFPLCAVNDCDDIIFPCAQFPICLISDYDGVISSTNRDRLYYLDTELRLLRNLTWETDSALLPMCSDSTVSSVAL